ncbi:hypothetical protein BC939DRAFT_216583 [Gamsiella multidivaricata]|uniref:uncharacterized protein n=1 Tax=Gamsiella multidivaricata TaxID=101098 RepID=UPI00221E91DF|nr:uncharacterized protein BC939DRAFT_216583 [Gamsiella multidivaricata]KAI7821001.1 hypothetical protein BC939DRAFT_216583 [Gamsiella multidivaricata]
MRLDLNVALLMVEALIQHKFVVKSFVRADVSYIVRHNNDVTSIVSCSCADYCLHLIPCKHMYLVQRLYKSVRVSYSGEPAIESAIEPAVAQEQHVQNMDFFGPDLEAGLAPLLRLQLDRKRAAEQEFERVAREVATRQEFEDNEGLLMGLMKQMGAAVEARKKRKCTLEYLKSVVATTKNTLLEIQGLNASQAGQRYQK